MTVHDLPTLSRDIPSDDLNIRESKDGRTVFGTVVPYGRVATVSDGGAPYKEAFAMGAFARSIEQRGSKVKLMVNHDRQRLPIGRATLLEERSTGLYGEFLVSRTNSGDEALALVADGAVDSFSVGFKPVAQRNDGGVTLRTEAALREVSLVGFPAYEDALVSGVRSQLEAMTEAELVDYVLSLPEAERTAIYAALNAPAAPGTGTDDPAAPGTVDVHPDLRQQAIRQAALTLSRIK